MNFAEENRHFDLPGAVYRGDLQSEPPHTLYERPAGDQVRCMDCAHGRQAPDTDAHGWRLCDAGQGGRFAMALHFCRMVKPTTKLLLAGKIGVLNGRLIVQEVQP